MQNRILYRMDKQNGPNLYRELFSIYYDEPQWKRKGKRIYIYIYIYICIYIYIKQNHFSVQQKLTQHRKSTILQ